MRNSLSVNRTIRKRSSKSSSSSRSTISTIGIKEVIDKLKMNGMRESTKSSYLKIWRGFNEFYLRLDIKPTTWEDCVILYAGYLADQKRKSGTIKSYVSAVKAVLRFVNVEINEDRILLGAITKVCRLQNDYATPKLPIHKKLLNLLISQLGSLFGDQPYLLALYQAMFTTAYYGLSRIREITKGSHPILAKDVHIGSNKKKLMFILHTSKTHWKNNKPQLIKITASQVKKDQKTSKLLRGGDTQAQCPYDLLRNYIRVRENYNRWNEPFFVFKGHMPVAPHHFRKVLKKALIATKLDFRCYSGHSFRIGRSTDLLKLGVPIDTIKKLGRWKSNCVYTYLR